MCSRSPVLAKTGLAAIISLALRVSLLGLPVASMGLSELHLSLPTEAANAAAFHSSFDQRAGQFRPLLD